MQRASFFQQKNVREAVAAGDAQWLIQHEDLLVFRLGLTALERYLDGG